MPIEISGAPANLYKAPLELLTSKKRIFLFEAKCVIQVPRFFFSLAKNGLRVKKEVLKKISI